MGTNDELGCATAGKQSKHLDLFDAITNTACVQRDLESLIAQITQGPTAENLKAESDMLKPSLQSVLDESPDVLRAATERNCELIQQIRNLIF